ncbi:MAG TPA: RNA polymerase sigma factor [Candidatus Peribacteria bacterium]|nr:RNA polymerase sigma factor [Candidatus Peribacteria bacterium]
MAPQPIPAEELQALVKRAQDGETEAFGKIYDAYLTPIYRYVVFRFPQELAEDLVADIFVKAWEKLHSYKSMAGVPFSAWLFRIARHVVVDAYRGQRGFEEISEDIVDESSSSDPKLATERSLSVGKVRGALNGIPRYYREILLLHYVSGLSHAEIARSLRITEGGVRILKFRALKKLEALLPSDGTKKKA